MTDDDSAAYVDGVGDGIRHAAAFVPPPEDTGCYWHGPAAWARVCRWCRLRHALSELDPSTYPQEKKMPNNANQECDLANPECRCSECVHAGSDLADQE